MRQRMHPNRSRPGPAGDVDRGSVSAYMVVFILALLAVAGLVFDGGAALAARGQAANIAQQAARAGADAMLGQTLRGGGAAVLDPAAGAAAARSVVQAAGVDDANVTAGPDAITVTVKVHKPTALLSMVGIDTVGGSATATAIALQGRVEEGN